MAVLNPGLQDTSTEIIEELGAQMAAHQAFFQGDLVNAGAVTVLHLDAINGQCRNVKAILNIDGVTAGAGIDIIWYVGDHLDPATLDQVYPNVVTGLVTGGNRSIVCEFGDLHEEGILELEVDSAGDDSGLDYAVMLTYLQ